MAKNGNTYKDLYALVDATRKELNSSILRLETKFDNLEAGRLSSLESKFASLEARIFATAAVIGFIISLGVSIGSKFIKWWRNHF